MIKYIYFIKYFDLKTDIKMAYPLKERELYYSYNDLIESLESILYNIHDDYKEAANCNISYDDFFNKFNLKLEISMMSLNRNYITNEKEEKQYLERIKTIKKEDLFDYLMSFVNDCSLFLDYRFNLKQAYTYVSNDTYKDFTFSIKSLFPDKYHIDKFTDGDRVIYEGKEYIISKLNMSTESIYEYHDPLNYISGYNLMDENGYFLSDDRYGYYPTDEELKKVCPRIKKITEDQVDDIKSYIYESYLDHIIIDDKKYINRDYDKLIRADSFVDVECITKYNENFNIKKPFSYIFLYNNKPIVYIISIDTKTYSNIQRIVIKYNDIIIDTIICDSVINSEQVCISNTINF